MVLIAFSAYTFKKYSNQSLQLVTESLSSQIQAAIVFDDKVTISETLTTFLQKYPLESIRVTAANGEPIAYVQDKNHEIFYYGLIQRMQDWLAMGGAGYIEMYHNGQPLATIQVKSNIYTSLQFLKLLFWILLFGFIFTLILIWITTRIFYRKISKSLRVLTESTQDITDYRDFKKRVPMGKIYEFNKIALSFNALLNEIQTWHYHLQQENSHLEHQALHDALTQLPNRAYFNQRLQELFENSQTQKNFALFYIDNNDFKEINDTYGHLVGDAVLREMAIRLKLSLNPEDFLARIGGDEFAVLLMNIHSAENAMIVARKLSLVSDAPLYLDSNIIIHFGFSIGVALSSDASSIRDLINQADQAMYTAKVSPKQKIKLYDPLIDQD